MGTKRGVDSGRKDSRGRSIKVAGNEQVQAATGGAGGLAASLDADAGDVLELSASERSSLAFGLLQRESVESLFGTELDRESYDPHRALSEHLREYPESVLVYEDESMTFAGDLSDLEDTATRLGASLLPRRTIEENKCWQPSDLRQSLDQAWPDPVEVNAGIEVHFHPEIAVSQLEKGQLDFSELEFADHLTELPAAIVSSAGDWWVPHPKPDQLSADVLDLASESEKAQVELSFDSSDKTWSCVSPGEFGFGSKGNLVGHVDFNKEDGTGTRVSPAGGGSFIVDRVRTG